MSSSFLGYIRLMRPANLPTAAADVLAGMAIAGLYSKWSNHSFNYTDGLWLVTASILLYAGGVVLNDVFDYKLDKIERPERPIPSGVVSLVNAAVFGGGLLVIGVVCALMVNNLAGVSALLLALAILLYDSFSKKYGILGPLNMGVCRGLNLLLGMSVFGVLEHWYYAPVPVVYIAAITLISRGEVHGDNKKHIVFAGILYALVIVAVLALFVRGKENVLQAVPFLILFAIMIYRPLIGAFKENSPKNIKKAVIGGVLSLILLDASLAVAFSQWWFALPIILLLPLSIWLSKLFAVT
ncbi:UbiA-like protein EboC [Kriegella aquimaris]|uniref:4-hydroxybenzoate polyprenyltransferase n=1 Tax=Kriegella aquimaris TaxID=192904 RepID=A0A1G9Y1F5_9FLAO|nr:UbiA-like protein EboC [Kriegella aquimaris]SDN02830.1 4-hydroxybenzoate polyprenyltransferase [Kriegella aquimaris]